MMGEYPPLSPEDIEAIATQRQVRAQCPGCGDVFDPDHQCLRYGFAEL